MTSTNPLDIVGFDVFYKNYNDEWEYYGGYFNLGESYYANSTVKSIIIVPDNNSGGTANYGETEIEFVDFDFNIESNTGEPPCLTFDNLNFRLLTNLDGLCNTFISLKMPPNSINTWGLGPNFSMDGLSQNFSYEIPIADSFCSSNNCLDVYGNTTACCFTFNFEITLRPCSGMEMECPEISFIKPFSICCYCGSNNNQGD